MKKLIWTILSVGWIATGTAQTQARLVDSLKNEYERQDDARKRVDILLNLKDLTETQEDGLHYARQLYREAMSVRDGFAAGASLGSLASHYIGTLEKADSLEILLSEAEPLLRGTSMEGLTTYYRMVARARKIQMASTEESVKLCRAYLDSLDTSVPAGVYEQAARLFLQGIAVYRLASTGGNPRMDRGLPYWNDELALLPRMSSTARRNFYANLITCLISSYSNLRDQAGLVRTADDYLAMLDEYFGSEEVRRRRPYISKEMSYMVCYYTMCTSSMLDRKIQRKYYERYRRYMESSASDVNNLLTNKRGFYNISIEYFTRQEDYAQAMAYNDSLIMMSRRDGMSSLLVGMYNLRASLLEKQGRYRDACGVYNQTLALRDSLSSYEYAQKVGELEVRYGLDKAERDKALLLAQKRQNTLYFAVVILLIAFAAVIYQAWNIRRIKRLQHNLYIESQRAMESDRLKRDFMRSMSHEIRTPLNAINGFAGLMADEDHTPEETAEFAQIIHDNTQVFTALIKDMLEVSQLDNTIAELPRTPLDICQLIRNEMEHVPKKEEVEFRLLFADPEVIVPLHRGYVSQLIRALLNNAVKFTERGSVTIECGRVERGELTFSVTDTGCGIAPELAEKIFERFYKADAFGVGLGLGLSLCRLIVEKLGGTIRLDTSYTEGARFVVTLKVS